jgi:Polyketide cyclase / dehydrase and lipid transport
MRPWGYRWADFERGGRGELLRAGGGVSVKFPVHSDIATPPEHAFDAMADARNEIHWNSKVTKSEMVGDSPIGQGSKFTTVNRGKPYPSVISTYDRPNLLVFEVTGSQMDITTTFTFKAAGEGTAVDSEFDFRPKGFTKAMFPVMKSLIRKDLAEQSARFARFCETR